MIVLQTQPLMTMLVKKKAHSMRMSFCNFRTKFILLLAFFGRYTLPDEADDLKKDVLKYIGGGALEP